MHDDFEAMFSEDENLLIDELIDLPRSSAERKLNELVKRIRIIKVHVCILSFIKKQMPRWFGKQKAQKRIIQNLENIFDHVRMLYDLSPGDFPDISEFTKCLEDQDFNLFPGADRQTMDTLDNLILKDIPNIVKGTNGVSVSNFVSDQPSSESTEKLNGKDAEKIQSKKKGSQIFLFIRFFFRVAFFLVALYVLVAILVYEDQDNSLKLPGIIVEHFKNSFEMVQDTLRDPKLLWIQLKHAAIKTFHLQIANIDEVLHVQHILEESVGDSI